MFQVFAEDMNLVKYFDFQKILKFNLAWDLKKFLLHVIYLS